MRNEKEIHLSSSKNLKRKIQKGKKNIVYNIKDITKCHPISFSVVCACHFKLRTIRKNCVVAQTKHKIEKQKHRNKNNTKSKFNKT